MRLTNAYLFMDVTEPVDPPFHGRGQYPQEKTLKMIEHENKRVLNYGYKEINGKEYFYVIFTWEDYDG